MNAFTRLTGNLKLLTYDMMGAIENQDNAACTNN